MSSMAPIIRSGEQHLPPVLNDYTSGVEGTALLPLHEAADSSEIVLI